MIRPKIAPTMKISATNVIRRIKKYFRDGDMTTVSYRSCKDSACGAT